MASTEEHGNGHDEAVASNSAIGISHVRQVRFRVAVDLIVDTQEPMVAFYAVVEFVAVQGLEYAYANERMQEAQNFEEIAEGIREFFNLETNSMELIDFLCQRFTSSFIHKRRDGMYTHERIDSMKHC